MGGTQDMPRSLFGTCLVVWLQNLLTWLPWYNRAGCLGVKHEVTYLLTYLPTYLRTYRPTDLPTYLPTHPLACLLACLFACLLAYLLTYSLTWDRLDLLKSIFDYVFRTVSLNEECSISSAFASKSVLLERRRWSLGNGENRMLFLL